MNARSFTLLLSLVLPHSGWSGPAPWFDHPMGEAPRAGMIPGSWTTGNKQFFGTAYEAYDAANRYTDSSATAPISRVWFTGSRGILNEIYWPTLDTPQVRDSQFLVTDGHGFFFEEQRDSVSRVEWLKTGTPAFRVTNSDRLGRFVIEKTIFTDPDSDVVVQIVKIVRNVPDLRFFILHKPQVGNTPLGDWARASTGAEPGAGLYAWQGRFAQALVSNMPFKRASAGFVGASDGWQDLNDGFSMDASYETASDGNVALTAWLDIPEMTGVTEFALALGFGSDVKVAHAVAQKALSSNVGQIRDKFLQQWQTYQAGLADLGAVSKDDGALYRASVAVLKSMEDKTFEGAFVASPSVPWGQFERDINSQITINGSRAHQVGGYHLVWPRDLYNMATSFMAVGDMGSAVASLNYLRRIQYKATDGEWHYGFRRRTKDGSFPQNVWVNGEAYWSGLQMDETAFPVILAYRLWKSGAIRIEEYWDLVRRAGDFIQEFGPWSLMERWEEAMGASPSTIAVEITALRAASEMAGAMGDAQRGQLYRATAEAWSGKPGDNLEAWTFTHSGGLGNGKYYARVIGAAFFEQIWNPDSEQDFILANDGGRWREKDLVDGGFLELVRMGVRRALDYYVQESISEVDASLRVDLPNIGPGFRRYTKDRYNRDDATGARTNGMPWPLLTGERAHYELQKAIELENNRSTRDRVVDPYIETFEAMASDSLMIPEQVWDHENRGKGEVRTGQSTGCATPLGWSHAEYIKLLRSRSDRRVFDRIMWNGM